MDGLHALLRRQWHRHLGRDVPPPDGLEPFLRTVSDAYAEMDSARRLVERALALSSEELHSANAELRGVLHVLPDLLFRVRADDGVSGVMQGSTVTSHPALVAFASGATGVSEEFRRSVEHVRSTRESVSFEFEQATVHGQLTFEVRLLPFVDADIIGIARDVTDRKSAEHDRLILGKLESTGILAGGIAHDFNNLLTSILLNAEMAAMPGTPPEETAESLATIRQGALAAQVLTQQLITFARGGTALRQPTVLSTLLRESVPLALSGSSHRAELSIPEELWPAEVDVGQIGQVVRNLVLNAREAMSDGGTVSIRAGNTVLSDGNPHGLSAGKYVEIVVADEGQGIAPDILPRLFDPYFSTKTRGTQKGMGLGLTICHSVVQRHGGAIAVESELGRGTSFLVLLPACEEMPRAADVEVPATAHARGTARVLVMDDEPMVLRAFSALLHKLGYDAVLVDDGWAAVTAYEEARWKGQAFDAVLLDLTVRGRMGGKEAVRELLARDPHARAIVMSGYSDDDVMREYARFGFCGRLTKPFDTEAVREVLARVVASGGPSRSSLPRPPRTARR
jgi:signal transduction histidine kinase/ActR/RegA family two-component response regulator